MRYKVVNKLLDSERLALLAVIALMILPYMAWLSMSALALVTLRNGVKSGTQLVIPAFTAHVIVLLLSVPLNVALIDGLIRVLPCYILACVLRCTVNWQVVTAAFILLALMAAVVLQMLAPELIASQFAYFKLVMQKMDSGIELMKRVEDSNWSLFVLSNYLVGVQIACLFVANLSSLMFARMLQSNMYYPGGFRQEVLNFRADKLSFLALIITALAAYFQQAVAMNCLPLLLFYFSLAGLSFSAHVLSQVKPFKLLVLLCLPCMILPRVVLPFYVMLGGIDSLVNFRLYLSVRAGKTT